MKRLLLIGIVFLSSLQNTFAALGKTIELNAALAEPRKEKITEDSGFFSGTADFF